MAIATLSSTPSDPASDMVTLKEASVLFKRTGHQVSPVTLKRWCARSRVPVIRDGRDNLASWSDLLEIHAAVVDAREGI
jgi:hypothetical protein